MTQPPTQHQDLPEVQTPTSASQLAVRLSRIATAVAETQERTQGLAMDLAAIQAELTTLVTGAVELGMTEIGPAYTDPPRSEEAQRARDSAATARALARDTDGGERSEHRGPFWGPRPRPVSIGQEPWVFAGVAL